MKAHHRLVENKSKSSSSSVQGTRSPSAAAAGAAIQLIGFMAVLAMCSLVWQERYFSMDNSYATTTRSVSTLSGATESNPEYAQQQLQRQQQQSYTDAKKKSPTTIGCHFPTKDTNATVVAWPYVERRRREFLWPQEMHLLGDGIEQSRHLHLSRTSDGDFRSNVVWIGEPMGVNFKADPGQAERTWCHDFEQAIRIARQQRKFRGLHKGWPIYIVDYNDWPHFIRCRNIEQLVGRDCVRYAKRSIAHMRHWDEQLSWVDVGEPPNLTTPDGIQYQHISYYVRTDTIRAIQESLVQRGVTSTLGSLVESAATSALRRTTDVAHFWPVHSHEHNLELQSVHLRDVVSHVLSKLQQHHPKEMTSFVGLAGVGKRLGRTNIATAYIDQLLDSKIVVVSQRDDWEDHFRLLEALVSGALVMTDFMHGLPAGFENGKNLIVYTSPQDLVDLILYYLEHDEERLQVASAGRLLAMERHRTWHRIEDIVFGEPLTFCEAKAGCPFVVDVSGDAEAP
jgi:hypothetical protein